jgi:hypothetical protein
VTGSAATPGHFMSSMTAFLPTYAGVALVLPWSPAHRAAALVPAVLLAVVDSFASLAISRRLAQRHRARNLESARTARPYDH